MTDLEGHIAETRRLCGSLTHMLQKDAQAVHMAFHPTSGADVEKSSRSTVGLMITGTRIDSVLPGGPAQGLQITKGTPSASNGNEGQKRSSLCSAGDKIIAVDHAAATSENVTTLLVGNDDPGQHPQFLPTILSCVFRAPTIREHWKRRMALLSFRHRASRSQ